MRGTQPVDETVGDACCVEGADAVDHLRSDENAIDRNTLKVAFVFPGQGSQHVGMGRELYDHSPAARRVFDDANEILGINLRDICFEGPEDVLTDTVNAQPAILTASIACLEAFRERCAEKGVTLAPSYVAGHSLGEYSALVAAGAMTFRDALLLVRERGRLMKEAGEQFPGGMAAVLGMDDESLVELCKEASKKGVVCVANFNSPGQTVISGDHVALGEAMRLALAGGARRAVRLAVSIAAHSPLMAEASARFTQAIDKCHIRQPQVPVLANVTAQLIHSADEIRRELSDQLCGSVRWQQTIMALSALGVVLFLEIGPGQVLTGLIKRTVKDVSTHSVNDLKSLENLWSTLHARMGGQASGERGVG